MSQRLSTLTSIITSIRKRDDLTQYKLKRILTYHPELGHFTWNGYANARAQEGNIAGTQNKGYRYVTINGIKFAVHRLAFLYMDGDYPEEVDHDDRIKWNNKWNNLKRSNRKLNNSNREDSITFIHNGVLDCLKGHCESLGVNYQTISYRVNTMCMTPTEALNYGTESECSSK